MFKFATNKFNGGGGGGGGSGGGGSNSSNHHNLKSNVSGGGTSGGGGGGGGVLSGLVDDNSAASRRRLLQKDLFAFNKIADKGFPSKPSAMDYDKKLKLLAIGTKNGDIRIYGSPGTPHQQLSCYQDVHPFPIQRLLFVQGQSQLITLSERVHRNDLTNKGESQLYLILWQIPHLDFTQNSASSSSCSSPNKQQHQQHQQQTLTSSPNQTNNVHSNLVEKIKEYQLDPKIVNGSRLSAMTLLNDNSHLFLGFESGDVYVFNVAAFQLVPGVINKDYILKNLPDASVQASSSGGKKLTQLGAVESICHHPRQLTKLLLAYQRGLWVIFDFIKNQIDQINQTAQQLESAVFYQAGECVATSHSDGSFILWDLETISTPPPPPPPSSSAASQSTTSSSTAPIPSCTSSSAPNIVYGPYPCKAVTKCLVKTCRNDQPFVIFSGGCPRINYSDKITISVIQGENLHVCFDFTSKIIDFFTIDKPNVEKQQQQQSNSLQQQQQQQQQQQICYDNPQALFVLLEEEFVAIDLVSEGWPQFKLPYLYSVHSSAIICTHYVNSVSLQFYEKLKNFGCLCQEPTEIYSDREWPIIINNSTTTTTTNNSNNSPSSINNNHHNQPTSQPTKSNEQRKDLLLTGHEDGTVRFWDVTQMSMTLIYRVKTSDYFQTDSTPSPDEMNPATASSSSNANDSSETNNANGDLDNWPPFRKVGTFDPYSDDPKLGIQKIFLCPHRELLVVGGTAGQVLIMSLNERSRDLAFSSIVAHKINITGASPEVESLYVWKGHEPLPTRGNLVGSNFSSSIATSNQIQQQITGSIKLQPGYQLHSLIQLYPPATISALALNSEWQLVAMGTAHGVALFDYLHMKDLLVRCTLDPTTLPANPNDSGNGGTTISRRKSLKKSLRESFRKLRRGRSQKPNNNNNNKKTQYQQIEGLNKTISMGVNHHHHHQMRVDHLDDDLADGQHHKPIERQVESREFKQMDDIPPSVVRYLYFVRTFITNSQQQTNSLWIGTNTGIIYIYALQFLAQASSQQQQQQQLEPRSKSHIQNVVGATIRSNQSINCLLAKEMRLKHRAPVVHIQVIDQNMHPLPYDSAFNGINQSHNLEYNTSGVPNHKVIICSEEQFKVFQLPTLKPVCKFKLTAIEGARVRRIGYSCYTSRSDSNYSEHCLSCLSNLGDLSVYNLPQLKRQVQTQCMKQQDINAITSFVFTKQGQAFYLQSPSEFVHISMSARDTPQQLMQQSISSYSSNNNNQIKQIDNKTTTSPTTTTTSSPTNKNQLLSSQQNKAQTNSHSNAQSSHQGTSSSLVQSQSQSTLSNKTTSASAASNQPKPVINNDLQSVSQAQARSTSPTSTSVQPAAAPPPVPAPRTIVISNNNNESLSNRQTNSNETTKASLLANSISKNQNESNELKSIDANNKQHQQQNSSTQSNQHSETTTNNNNTNNNSSNGTNVNQTNVKHEEKHKLNGKSMEKLNESTNKQEIIAKEEMMILNENEQMKHSPKLHLKKQSSKEQQPVSPLETTNHLDNANNTTNLTSCSMNRNNISEVINSSIATTNSGLSSSVFNQSSISSSTVNHNHTNTTTNNNNNNNISNQLNNLACHANSGNNNPNNSSLITTAQSDSFNVSSSGYNGSISCVGIGSSSIGLGVDLSMDSVVDRFNDEFDVLTKKIPASVIDENTSNIQNDSLLNESGIDLNRLNLDHKNSSIYSNGIKPQQLITNGHQNNNNNNSNNKNGGQINYTYDNESDMNRQPATGVLVTKHRTPNGHSNATNTNGHHHHHHHHHHHQQQQQQHNNSSSNNPNLNDDDELDLAPQKSSSPLIKQNHQATNGRANKIEQVTKRIENGNKKEYKETAID